VFKKQSDRRGKGNRERGFRGARGGSGLGRGSGQGRERQVEANVAVELPGMQVNYDELLEEGRGDETLDKLAALTMRARVDFECGSEGGKKEIYWHRDGYPWVSFTLTGKNFAAVQLEVDDIITEPVAFESAPGEQSTGSPSKHAERYALADAINQAIDLGWKPKFKEENLEKLNIPPQYEELAKFKDALKDASVTLFSEKSLCTIEKNRLPEGDINCSQAMPKILSGKNHRIYYAVIGNKEDQKLRTAREEYHKNTEHKAQRSFLAEHEEAVATVTKNNSERVRIGMHKDTATQEENRAAKREGQGRKQKRETEKVEKVEKEDLDQPRSKKARKEISEQVVMPTTLLVEHKKKHRKRRIEEESLPSRSIQQTTLEPQGNQKRRKGETSLEGSQIEQTQTMTQHLTQPKPLVFSHQATGVTTHEESRPKKKKKKKKKSNPIISTQKPFK